MHCVTMSRPEFSRRKRAVYSFVARLDFRRVVRCNGKWHWEFDYPVGARLNPKKTASHGGCDCLKSGKEARRDRN